MLKIGCHLSSTKGYEAMAKTAISINANTFQFFTRNPRGGKAKEINPTDIERYLAFATILAACLDGVRNKIEPPKPVDANIYKLSERERDIIDLRFYKGKTQMEIADEIGISQAQVSRIEKAALEKIKKQM